MTNTITTNETPLPCKCRLIMPNGNKRAFFRAKGVEDAERRALRILKKKALPKGWTLTVDGKAADLYPRLISTSTHGPRTFKVGDEVRGKAGRNGCGPVMQGVVFRIDGEGDIHFRVKDDPPSISRWAHPANLTLISPAPQPKAEEGNWQRKAEDYFLELMAVRNALGLHGGIDLPVGAASRLQEIATLKAEVERLNHSLADTRSECVENYHQFSAARDRAEAAEAKLADIQAINRVSEMVHALPQDAEPWHWQSLVQSVLDRV